MHLVNATVCAVVPFSGLGFDLSGATLLAERTRLVRRTREEPVSMPPPPPFVFARHGYGLMVCLGRETLGS